MSRASQATELHARWRRLRCRRPLRVGWTKLDVGLHVTSLVVPRGPTS